MAAQLAELTTAIPQLTQVPLCGVRTRLLDKAFVLTQY